MALARDNRQAIVESQRRTDNNNEQDRFQEEHFFREQSLRQAVVAAQREADSDNDESEEMEDPAENQKREKATILLRALRGRKQHIELAEKKLDVEKTTKPTLWGYKFVFILAGCKDLTDLSIVTTLPVIGWVVGSIFGISIFIALYLAKTNRSLFEIRRIAIFIVGYIVETFFPLVSLFPVQSVTVLLIFLIDKLESNKTIARAIQILENIQQHRL